MIKAVIFDWGGVIAPNANEGWLNVLANILDTTADNLLPHWRAAGYSDLTKGFINEDIFWQQFEKSLGKPLPKDLSRVWKEGSALNPWPEMLAFVKSLKDQDKKVAILSNIVEPTVKMARAAGLYDGFEPIILSNEVGLKKPNIEIYNLMLDTIKIPANECIYIDDMPENLIPAANLGMSTILSNPNDPSYTIESINQLMKS